MRKIAAYATGLILVLVGAVAGSAIAEVGEQNQSTPIPYMTNATGQSFGSNAMSGSPESDPDLVLVVGDHGTEGYVNSQELNPPLPTSPDQAVKEQTAPGEIEAVLPVYRSDGVTVIDTFTIRAAGGKTVATDE